MLTNIHLFFLSKQPFIKKQQNYDQIYPLRLKVQIYSCRLRG